MTNSASSVKQSGFVYIAKQMNTKDIYKIGKTDDITRREKDFTIGNPYIKLIAYKQQNNPFSLEAHLHKRLQKSCISGEWFYVPKEDLEQLVQCYHFNFAIDK